MQNFEITELLVFLAVARHKSFRRAAIERGMTASAVSHAIKRLETRLELRLIHRTTRSVSLTDPGAHFFAEHPHILPGETYP
jgi:DNA-binding transcriptional LysR family regulator